MTFADFPEAENDGRSDTEALHEAVDPLQEVTSGWINRGAHIHPDQLPN